jgi:hypothetical protein
MDWGTFWAAVAGCGTVVTTAGLAISAIIDGKLSKQAETIYLRINGTYVRSELQDEREEDLTKRLDALDKRLSSIDTKQDKTAEVVAKVQLDLGIMATRLAMRGHHE